MILSAQTIRRRCILSSFCERASFMGTSYGLSPSGYDLRLVLPDDVSSHILAPGEFILAAAVEHFRMPTDLLGIVHDKSTWARRGLSVFNTVIEPGWRGYLTLELVNHGSEALVLHAGQGIAQVVFHTLDVPTDEPYPETGKYMDQAYGPVAARE
jgi:dCTP deaminase